MCHGAKGAFPTPGAEARHPLSACKPSAPCVQCGPSALPAPSQPSSRRASAIASPPTLRQSAPASAAPSAASRTNSTAPAGPRTAPRRRTGRAPARSAVRAHPCRARACCCLGRLRAIALPAQQTEAGLHDELMDDGMIGVCGLQGVTSQRTSRSAATSLWATPSSKTSCSRDALAAVGLVVADQQ